MIVFIAGMQRSGSTFCFNVVREILEQSGVVYCSTSGDLSTAVESAGAADHLVLKAHSASPDLIRAVRDGRVRSIVSIRPIEEVVASCMELWGMGLDSVLDRLTAWREMYGQIGDVSLKIRFPTIDQNPEEAVRAIAAYIAPDADTTGLSDRYAKASVAARVRNMAPTQPGIRDVGFSYYDERTFFHRRHVLSDGPRDVRVQLSPADRERVRRQFPDLD